jgi:hypothetical protein
MQKLVRVPKHSSDKKLLGKSKLEPFNAISQGCLNRIWCMGSLQVDMAAILGAKKLKFFAQKKSWRRFRVASKISYQYPQTRFLFKNFIAWKKKTRRKRSKMRNYCPSIAQLFFFVRETSVSRQKRQFDLRRSDHLETSFRLNQLIRFDHFLFFHENWFFFPSAKVRFFEWLICAYEALSNLPRPHKMFIYRWIV